jgi:hypothetical protein
LIFNPFCTALTFYLYLMLSIGLQCWDYSPIQPPLVKLKETRCTHFGNADM